MATLEAQRLLEHVIIDYMCKRGFHQTGEVFLREIFANQNPDAINSLDEAFLQAWWGNFYEAYSSRFPDFPVLAAECFDKVAETVENVVANNGPANQFYSSDHTGVNISNVMPVMPSPQLMVSSPLMESSSPDPMDAMISDLMSRDIPSDLQSGMNEMYGMLPFASNVGYQMPTVPPEWNARDDRPDINLGGPAQMELNNHAAANALPASPELSDAGYNGSLQQGWPSVELAQFPVISHHVEHPSVIVPTQKGQFLRTTSFPQQDNVANQTLDMLKHPSPASSGEFFHLLTQADLSVNILGDTNQRIPENLTADQQIIAPRGGIVRSSGKQPAEQSKKRKTPMSSWESPSNCIQDLVEHAGQVMSIDFHPTETGLLSSCDSNDEIRLWDINRGDCRLILKGGSRRVRFQPRHGDLLASSTGNIINIFDVKTNNILKKLQRHIKDVRSICWDFCGRYLASACEDSARIWSVSEGKCIFELFSGGNNFQSCTFRPSYSQVLVIGSNEFLELWNPILKSNTTLPYSVHAGIIPSLADSHPGGIIARVSHDQLIKIWR